MSDDPHDHHAAYVRGAALLTGLPLTEDRERAVGTVMGRIAAFAADLDAFPLSNEVEIAGVFTP